MSQLEEFVQIYEYFQSIILSNPQYELRRINYCKIEKFLEDCQVNDMWEYLAFQFCFKSSSYSRFGVLPINHFIGKTALKRYKTRTKQQMFIVSKFLMQKELKDPRKKIECLLSQDYIDKIRSKNFNTPKGFIECSFFKEIIYNEEKCKNCQFEYVCKDNSNSLL